MMKQITFVGLRTCQDYVVIVNIRRLVFIVIIA